MKKRKLLLNRLFVGAMSAAMIGAVPATAVFAAPAQNTAANADQNTQQSNQMQSVSIGGVNYYYVNTAGKADTTEYALTIKGRHGAKDQNYTFKKADLTQVGSTDYYYKVLDGTAPLSGTLYGYDTNSGKKTNYRAIYKGLGVTTDKKDTSYDAVTSATNYSSHHVKDIPSLADRTADASGNQAITGITLNRSEKTVDAKAYVEASILKAAGAALTADQTSALDITLKKNPMVQKSSKTVDVKTKQAVYTATSKYGNLGEFDINPDDTASGYTWSEYWDSVYAATISDGANTAAAVHWIDMYGEESAAGPHYNKLQIAINDGTSVAANAAAVNRYAAFVNKNTAEPTLTAGKYTIKVYAEGYSTLTAEAEVPGVRLDSKTAEYTGKPVEISAAKTFGDTTTGAVTYTYYSDKDCTQKLDGAPTEIGTYYVKAEAAADATHEAAASNTAKLVISKKAQKVTVSTKKKTIQAKALKKKAQSFKIAAKSTGNGKITFKKTSGSKKIAVSKNGKVTVKKNTKKGTYKIKVTATAKATASYAKGVKNATISVKVK